MKEEAWRKVRLLPNEELIVVKEDTIFWKEKGVGENFSIVCTLLKENLLPATTLYLSCKKQQIHKMNRRMDCLCKKCRPNEMMNRE